MGKSKNGGSQMTKVTLFAAAMTVAVGLTHAQAQVFGGAPADVPGPFLGTPGAGSPGQDQRPDFLNSPGMQPGTPFVADSPTTIAEFAQASGYGRFGGYGGYPGNPAYAANPAYAGSGAYAASGGFVESGVNRGATRGGAPAGVEPVAAPESRRVPARSNRSNARSTTGAAPPAQ
jgi:hypothetical protein